MNPSPFSRTLAAAALVAALFADIASSQACREACDIAPGATSSSAQNLTCVWGNLLLLGASTNASGKELFGYDLATRQCSLIADIQPGPTGSWPAQLTACGDKVYFSANGPSGDELYEWDGRAVKLHDIRPGPAGSSPRWLTVCNNRLFFTATDGTSGIELWIAEPVSGRVRLVADIAQGASSSAPSFLVCAKDKVYFRANDGNGAGGHGDELWESDGTGAGTKLVSDIRTGPLGSNLGYLTYCPDLAGRFRLFLAADDGRSGNELFVYDGNRVTLVADIVPGAGSSLPVLHASAGGRVYFAATSGNTGSEPWVSDGTAPGTLRLGDLCPGAASSNPSQFVCVRGGRVLFTATNGAANGTGTELYATDGTVAGTGLVRDIQRGSPSSSPRWLVAVGKRVYFAADDGARGNELWVSDGSANGTQLVSDIAMGAGSSNPGYLEPAGGSLYFAADGGRNGTELWTMPSPGAGVEVIGQGGDGIELDASEVPVLGGSLQLEGRGAPQGHVGVTFFVNLPARGGPVHVPPVFDQGAYAWLDLGSPFFTSVTTRWQSPKIAIPNQPWLRGVSLFFQSYYVNLRSVVPVKTSNGLLVTFGD